MRILLTGGTGFIGRNAYRALSQAGHEVIRLARDGADLNIDVRWLSPDSVPRVDAIVHLAGLADAGASDADAYEFMSSNAVGTMRVLEVARKQRCPTIIASSMRVYRPSTCPLAERDGPTEPREVYGVSKLTAELWGRVYSEAYGQTVSVLRLFSVYGPGQLARASGSGVVSVFAHCAMAGQPLVVYCRQARDFVHVDDVSRSIALALDGKREGWRIYNIATGVSTTIETLARIVVGTAGNSPSIDLSLARRPGDSFVADVTRAKDELGYAARIGLRDGVKSYLAWLKTEDASG